MGFMKLRMAPFSRKIFLSVIAVLMLGTIIFLKSSNNDINNNNTNVDNPRNIPEMHASLKKARTPRSEVKATTAKHAESANMVKVDDKLYSLPADLRLRLPWTATKFPDGAPIEFIAKRFKRLLEEIHVDCRTQARVGSTGDGGWDVCLAGPYRPSSDCLVYDFGINNVWTFDDAFAEEFGCDVRAFDPTMKEKEHKRGKHVYFYPIGLHGKNGIVKILKKDAEVKTLSSIRKDYGDEDRIIDYLKIDIENSEWAALPNMLAEDFFSTHVKQIGIEIHTFNFNHTESYKRSFNMLNWLENRGFRKWHHHGNNACMYKRSTGFYTMCNELYYINMNLLSI